MRPAWKNWRELVWREQGEEDEFAGREEGLLAFAAVLTRVGKRRDRARKHRALGVWRIGVARAAVSAAQQQAALRAGVAAVENGKKVRFLGRGAEVTSRVICYHEVRKNVACKAWPPAVHAWCFSCEELQQSLFICACGHLSTEGSILSVIGEEPHAGSLSISPVLLEPPR